jgi:hypothetical protein
MRFGQGRRVRAPTARNLIQGYRLSRSSRLGGGTFSDQSSAFVAVPTAAIVRLFPDLATNPRRNERDEHHGFRRGRQG